MNTVALVCTESKRKDKPKKLLLFQSFILKLRMCYDELIRPILTEAICDLIKSHSIFGYLVRFVTALVCFFVTTIVVVVVEVVVVVVVVGVVLLIRKISRRKLKFLF